MSFDKAATLIVAGIVIAIIIVFVALCVWLESYKCANRWNDYVSRYTLTGGCQVNINAKWTPERNVRL